MLQVIDPDGAGIFKHDFGCMRPAADHQILVASHGLQIARGGAAAPAFPCGELIVPRTLLRGAVEIRVGRDADFPRSPDEGFDQLVRSEEHTSELQSLMRNSYAVF